MKRGGCGGTCGGLRFLRVVVAEAHARRRGDGARMGAYSYAYSTELESQTTRADAKARRPKDPSALEAELGREAARAFDAPLARSVRAYMKAYEAGSERADDVTRTDADPVKELERLGGGLESRWSSAAIGKVVNGKFKQLTNEIDADLEGQVERVVGVRPDLAGIPGSDAALEAASKRTVELMQGVMPDAHARMSAVVLEGYRAGSANDVIARRLEEVAGIGRRRAAFVARNEAGNLYAAHTELRHRDLGITHYIWRTSMDERVRPSHAAHEGKRYAWDDPPDDTGPPGADYNCRCTAEPDLESALGDLEGDEPDPEEIPVEARLKGWRKELGWKQGDLADRLGRSKAYVSKLERGLAELDAQDRRRLRAALSGEGLDEAALDALLGTVEGIAPDVVDPAAEAVAALVAPPAENLGVTGAPVMSSREAIDRLKAATGPTRGAELSKGAGGNYFASFDEVEELIHARRDLELKRFSGKGASPKTIKAAKAKRLDLEAKAKATRAEILKLNRERDTRKYLASKPRIAELKEALKVYDDAVEAMGFEIDGLEGGVDFDALVKSLASETVDSTPLDYQTGRWRKDSGRLLPEGKARDFTETWDPKAKAKKIPQDGIEGVEDFAEMFGDARGKKYARGELPQLKVGSDRDRAYQQGDIAYINIGRGPDRKSTMYHEIGHYIEAQNDVLAEAAQRSVVGRAQRSKASVEKIYASSRNSAERGFVSISPANRYVGKIYTQDPRLLSFSGGKFAPDMSLKGSDYRWDDLVATEFTTVAIQEFVSPARAKALHDKDPDMFWHVVAMSRGDLR